MFFAGDSAKAASGEGSVNGKDGAYNKFLKSLKNLFEEKEDGSQVRLLFSMASIMQTPPILCAHAAAYAL